MASALPTPASSSTDNLDQGALLLFLDVPEGTEFGIDYKSWNVGHRFRGLKMIPPGVHFVYYSMCDARQQAAPRTGFFYNFKPKEIVIRKWDKYNEDIQSDDIRDEERERILSNLPEIMQHLGPYPIDSYKTWVALTSYLKGDNLSRLQPIQGRISAVPQLVSEPSDSRSRLQAAKSQTLCDASVVMRDEDKISSDVVDRKDIEKNVDENYDENKSMDTRKSDLNSDLGENRSTSKYQEHRDDLRTNVGENHDSVISECDYHKISHKVDSHDKLPIMPLIPGTEIRFTRIPHCKYPPDSTPAEITKYSMDTSYVLECLLNAIRSDDINDAATALLGEIQFAFVCFLVGQVYDAFEQWKKLVAILCSSEEYISKCPKLFIDFISVLHFQIREVPEDFFVDIVTQNNFLTTTLYEFFENVKSTDNESLKKRALKFKDHLTEKFKWDFTTEPNEYAPVVVNL